MLAPGETFTVMHEVMDFGHADILDGIHQLGGDFGHRHIAGSGADYRDHDHQTRCPLQVADESTEQPRASISGLRSLEFDRAY